MGVFNRRYRLTIVVMVISFVLSALVSVLFNWYVLGEMSDDMMKIGFVIWLVLNIPLSVIVNVFENNKTESNEKDNVQR